MSVCADWAVYAKQYLGVKYVYAGSDPVNGWDCSGFTMYVAAHFGVTIDHGTKLQYSEGTPIPNGSETAGDFVYFHDTADSGISHVGIVTDVANHQMINALNEQSGTVFSDYSTQYWVDHWTGFVRFCTKGTPSSTTTAAPPPPPTFTKGATVEVTGGAVNLRSGAGTSYAVIATMQVGTQGVVLAGPVSANGFQWYQWQTPTKGIGWSIVDDLAASLPQNWLADPNAETDLAYIFANRTSSPISYVSSYNGENAVVKCVAQGSQTYEGMRFESTTGLNLTVQRYFVGMCYVCGSGVLDYLTIRQRYTDGTYADSTHPAAVTLTSSWQWIVTPEFSGPPAGKTIDKLEFHLIRAGVAAQTFYVDAAFVYALANTTS